MYEITVNKSKLLTTLSKLAPALAKNISHAYPCYLDYLIEVNCHEMKITASDGFVLTISATIDIELKADQETNPFLIDSRNLIKVLRLLDDQPIKMVVMHSQVCIFHDKGLFYVSKSEDYIPFKKIDKYDNTVKLEIPDVKKWLNCCTFAMADDELRPVMNGLLFDFRGKMLHLAASNGHVLTHIACASVPVVAFDGMYILHRKAVNTLLRVLPKNGMLTVAMTKEVMEISVKGEEGKDLMVVRTKLIDGCYPNYQSVIPHNFDYTALIDRKMLLAAVRRAALFTNKSGCLRFVFTGGDDTVKISCNDDDFECHAEENVSVEFHNNNLQIGQQIKLGFKYSYLVDILKRMTDGKIVLNMIDSSRPSTITSLNEVDDKTTYLVMPMWIND